MHASPCNWIAELFDVGGQRGHSGCAEHAANRDARLPALCEKRLYGQLGPHQLRRSQCPDLARRELVSWETVITAARQ